METLTSNWISLGTDLFLSKITILLRNSHYPTPTVIHGDEMHFYTHFLFIKTTEKKSSDKLFTDKKISTCRNHYAHCRTGKSREISCTMTM